MFDTVINTGYVFGYNGKFENAFCEEFSKLMGGGYADAVNSGTNAVYIALRALELKPFSEVIVSAITDPGGMMPIPLLNLIPVIADTEPGKYNVGPVQIEKIDN